MPEPDQSARTMPQAPARRRRISRKFAIVLVTMAVAIALLLLFALSSAHFEILPLTMLGTTNTPNGQRMVLFSVSNVIDSQISFFAATEEKKGGIWPFETNPSIGRLNWMSNSWVLAAHASDCFVVPAPSNGLPWRIWVQYSKAPTARDRVFQRVGGWLRNLGMDGIGDTFEAFGDPCYMFPGPELAP